MRILRIYIGIFDIRLSLHFITKLSVNPTLLLTPVCNIYTRRIRIRKMGTHSLGFMIVIQGSLQCLFNP